MARSRLLLAFPLLLAALACGCNDSVHAASPAGFARVEGKQILGRRRPADPAARDQPRQLARARGLHVPLREGAAVAAADRGSWCASWSAPRRRRRSGRTAATRGSRARTSSYLRRIGLNTIRVPFNFRAADAGGRAGRVARGGLRAPRPGDRVEPRRGPAASCSTCTARRAGRRASNIDDSWGYPCLFERRDGAGAHDRGLEEARGAVPGRARPCSGTTC